MKRLLQTLFPATKQTKDTSQILAKAYEESHYKSLWQDTGEVLYLFDTIKLTFESELGPVTYEKLDEAKLNALLAAIAKGDNPALTQQVTAEQTAEIRISICGITWQQFNGKTRAMALPEAAVLRFVNPSTAGSQAVFKHADLMSNIDSSVLTLPNQHNVFTYNDVTVDAFFTQLRAINTRFAQNEANMICLNNDNYRSPFTPSELNSIKRLNVQNDLPALDQESDNAQTKV